jgi:photosystem II stability/assembly factor-like uncharacterized protein
LQAVWFRRWVWALLAVAGAQGVARASEVAEPRPAVQAPLAAHAVLLDLALAGERVVAAGERGIVLYSDDAGRSWKQAQVPVRGTLTALAFLDARHGFAVGHDAVILRTADAGETWELAHFDPASENVYLNIRFRSPQWGYIAGTNGRLLITQDGGATWQAQTLSVEEWYQNHLFDVVWNDESTLIAAEKGVLYRSSDGLSGWEPVESPYEGSYFGAETLRDGRFVLYGMSGRIYVGSKDRGWTRIRTGTEQFLYDAQLLADGTVIVVGAGGVYGVVQPREDTARVRQRANRVGLTAVLVDGERAFLASEAGGVSTLPLQELLAD